MACALMGVGLTAPAFAVDPTPLDPVTCPTSLNAQCVANDVVTTLVSAQVANNDDCADGEIDLIFTVEYATTANENYDLAVFISEDGGTINGGGNALECSGKAAQAGFGDPDAYPDADPDLFQSLDDDEQDPTPDTCGDLSTDQGPVQWTVSATVDCFTAGSLELNSCRVWEQSANHSVQGQKDGCTDVAEAGTGSKCDCTPIDFGPVLDPCLVTDCSDGNSCTEDQCTSGGPGTVAVCTNTPIDPNDGNACTEDSCDPATGVSNTPIDPDDGNACTVHR
jgi:hypothetical protein